MADPVADTTRELIARYFEDELTDTESLELRDELVANPDARAVFTAYALNRRLVPTCVTAVVPVEAEPVPDAVKIATGQRVPPFVLSFAAALLVSAAVIAVYIFATQPPRDTPGDLPSAPPIATLVDATGTVIIDDTVASRGDNYAAGAYSIESGSAELLLINHVGVRLTGKTLLNVKDTMASTLMRGTAAFRCPPGATGYTVRLPDGSRVVDLGTRFLISVEHEAPAIVVVDEGKVTIEPGVDIASTPLVAGQAAQRHADGWVLLDDARAAYPVAAGTVGNQEFGGAVGLDFDVDRPTVVTHLGAFDSGADGLKRPITVTLYDRSAREPRVTMTLSEADGELIGSTRYVALDEALVLRPGFAGTIVASGYGDDEPLFNLGADGRRRFADTAKGGSVRHVGGGRFGEDPGAFPDVVDRGPADRYAAGSFRYLTLSPTPAADATENPENRPEIETR